MALTASGVLREAFPSFVWKLPPMLKSTQSQAGALAFLRPLATKPYMPGGLWNFWANSSISASVLGGFKPFCANRSFR